jgi:hypothetical protein
MKNPAPVIFPLSKRQTPPANYSLINSGRHVTGSNQRSVKLKETFSPLAFQVGPGVQMDQLDIRHDPASVDIHTNISPLGLGRCCGFLGFLIRRNASFSIHRLVFLGLGSLSLTTIRRGPKSEIITQQLHDKGAVTVRLFREGV